MAVKQPFGTAASDNIIPLTSINVGTLLAGITAVEQGDARQHQSVLTLATTLPAIAGGAALGVGKLIYTFPAGVIVIHSVYMNAILTAADGNIDADTPDVGIGTVIASGVVSVLSGTGTFEDQVTGQTATDCTGTAILKTTAPTAGAAFIIEAADAHTLHLNVADSWAASGETDCPLTGTVIINWDFMI